MKNESGDALQRKESQRESHDLLPPIPLVPPDLLRLPVLRRALDISGEQAIRTPVQQTAFLSREEPDEQNETWEVI